MMEVKRAFRKYLGPDDPGPFSDMINSMSFGCRHMKEFNPRGVFCLTANTPDGYVKVLRVGDVDYIWTEGGASSLIYIILVPDLIGGWKIPVTLKKGDYTFGEMSGLEDITLIRASFEKDLAGAMGTLPRFEYMPYISKPYERSFASVGYVGDVNFLDPLYDWHFKYYILDCTGDASDDPIWRPPYQGTWYAMGVDLVPPWYSLSEWTAHNYHWCFEAAIDQMKRIYQPATIEVVLDSEEIVPAGLTLSNRNKLTYVFIPPMQTNRFYGKNSGYVKNSEGIYELVSFAESIYVNGVGDLTVPDAITPIYFFWPWIPYLDEIRGFNILSYGPNDASLTDTKWYMTPELDTMRSWGIGYYNKLGQYLTEQLFKDAASFSNVTYPSTPESIAEESPCGCGDCGTGTWEENEEASVPPYNSSGTRYIPIGLIGGKIPISMKTIWSQTGAGPNKSTNHEHVISGNYPYNSLLESGGGANLAEMYESCCISDFANTSNRTQAWTESAHNSISFTQKLMVGDDEIFSGESSMAYNMSYSLSDSYEGDISAVIVPPTGICSGSIEYTTLLMDFNEQQLLSISDPSGCSEYKWELSGGGSLSNEEGNTTVYTAPASNASCAYNPTITLSCRKKNGAYNQIDQLSIAVSDADLNIDHPTYSAGYICFYELLSCTMTGNCPGPGCYRADIDAILRWVGCDGVEHNQGLCGHPYGYGWTCDEAIANAKAYCSSWPYGMGVCATHGWNNFWYDWEPNSLEALGCCPPQGL
jgi:hypothetical protein